MKALWIYDQFLRVKVPALEGIEEVSLFSLTADFHHTKQLESFIKQNTKANTVVIDSAGLVQNAARSVKKRIAKWSANIGEAEIKGRKLKNWLYDNKLRTSTWWFGNLSGKNTFQTDVFLQLAQTNAIKKHIDRSGYTTLILQVQNRLLRLSIKNIARKLNLQFFDLYRRQPTNELKSRLKIALRIYPFAEAVTRGLYHFIIFLRIRYRIRNELQLYKKRTTGLHSTMLVSPFPAIDKSKLKNGQHINPYFAKIQDKFSDHEEGINWLFHYVGKPGKQLRSSIDDAGTLLAMGEKVFFIHEFLDMYSLRKGFLIWMQRIILSLFLYRYIRNHLFQEPASHELEPILKHAWYESMIGFEAVEGILYGLSFLAMTRLLPTPARTIYCAEMRAWEKAMNAIFACRWPDMQTIGFQHAAISSSYYHFFYDPTELNITADGVNLPLPSILALSGKQVTNLLSSCQYPGIVQVEAIRFLEINSVLDKPIEINRKKNLLLVAGSISKEETSTLVYLVHKAFPSADNFEICLKPHPHCLLDDIFTQLGIDPDLAGYKVINGNIAAALTTAKAVIVPTSTVSIEALAYGCEIVIPVVPDGLLMNPLSDFTEFYHSVTTPEQLRYYIDEIMQQRWTVDMLQRKQFIRDYWFTDPDLPMWEKLLWGRK